MNILCKVIYEKGNIVKISKNSYLWNLQDAEDLYVIEEVYIANKGSKSNIYPEFPEYSILRMKDGRGSAWHTGDKFEFVSEGSPDEIDKCIERRRQLVEKHSNLEYIKEEIINGNLDIPIESIVKLFHEIGYYSSFENYGETTILVWDWEALKMIFVHLFLGEYDEMINEIKKKLKNPEKYIEKAKKLYNETLCNI